MSRFYRFAKRVLTVLVSLLTRFKTDGLENIPKDRKYIICCNHTSLVDIPMLITAFDCQIHFMAKEELFRIPVFRGILKKMGAFPVNRGKSDRSAIKKAKEIISNGGIIGIFPEGTRKKKGAPAPAKAGVALLAAQTGAEILPVSVYRNGGFCIFKKNTMRIGKLITKDELGLKQLSHNSFQNACTLITERITELWEKGHL